MAEMMIWLAQVLRNEGLRVVEYPGWQTRGRNTMTPKGVVAHHTGGQRTNDQSYADFLVAGRSDLAGPLAQLFLARDGTFWVLAAGKANHAGEGGWKGLVGNSTVIGIEAESTGKDGWPPEQYEPYVRGTAALLRRIGRNAEWVCGHKEWATPPGRKWDPGSMNMDAFRADVARHLIPEELPLDHLTPKEIEKLRTLIRSVESVDSNMTFAQYAIKHIREARKG